MKKVIGRFYFKLSENGNLLGEYSNEGSTECDVEAAKRIPAVTSEATPVNLFEGEYTSTWTEGKEVVSATLKITRRSNAVGIFSVIWCKGGRDLFTGGAMMVDRILIGNYESKEQ